MKLPEQYLKTMQTLLKEEFDEFLDTYNDTSKKGLRVNTLKIKKEHFLDICHFKLTKVQWAEDGFYIEDDSIPGKHPLYFAGAYYIQEPSAMAPVEFLNVQRNDKILDLCSAPGGKTVQIAAKLKNTGLIVSNDISPKRVKALIKNIELFGLKNAVVLNEKPENLINNFRNYFDKILVDAPCSGEGMFRKNSNNIKSWEKYTNITSSHIQKEILGNAGNLLRSGGRLVYSTCTFNPEEDEKVIADFLTHNKNFSLVAVKKQYGMVDGVPNWADGNKDLEKTIRLWPHKIKGEGHFIAVMEKSYDKLDIDNQSFENFTKEIEIPQDFFNFLNENLNTVLDGYFYLRNEFLFYTKERIPSLNGLKVIKTGLLLGSFKNERFQPAQAFISALKKEDVKSIVEFNYDDINLEKYLRGETLLMDNDKGYKGIFTENCSVGWAKQDGRILKNLYQKAWRINY